MIAAKGEKILVVDDEPDSRIFLTNLLDSDGFCPVTAQNREDGFNMALQAAPSVIILNMMMPGEGGIHLYRSLKRHEHLKRIPVIMLSALDRQTFLKCHNIYGYRPCKAYEQVDRFLEKPPEADEILTMVRTLSGRRASVDSV